jgi:hypothetical protein
MIRDALTSLAVLASTLLVIFVCSCRAHRTVEVQMVYGSEVGTVVEPVSPELMKLLSDVEALTGYWIKPVRKTGVKVELLDVVPNVQGRAWRILWPCWYFIRSNQDPRILAHELGHVLGLDHHADVGNLMNAKVLAQNPKLTATQRKTMERRAKELERLCWDSAETDLRYASVGDVSTGLLCDADFEAEGPYVETDSDTY